MHTWGLPISHPAALEVPEASIVHGSALLSPTPSVTHLGGGSFTWLEQGVMLLRDVPSLRWICALLASMLEEEDGCEWLSWCSEFPVMSSQCPPHLCSVSAPRVLAQ